MVGTLSKLDFDVIKFEISNYDKYLEINHNTFNAPIYGIYKFIDKIIKKRNFYAHEKCIWYLNCLN